MAELICTCHVLEETERTTFMEWLMQSAISADFMSVVVDN